MDVEKILADKRRRETGTKPLPIIKAPTQTGTVQPIMYTPTQTVQRVIKADQLTLLEEREQELAKLKKERAILSSQNSKLIDEVEQKLRKENPLLAEEFLKGKLPAPELAEHYAKMQILLNQTTRLYDDIEKLKRGETPDLEPAGINANVQLEADAIRTQIRALDCLITKTSKKIEGGKPKNPDRLIFWKEKLAMANAKRDDLKTQLKKLR